MHKVVKPGSISGVICRVDLAETLAQRLGDAFDVSRVQVYMGIALRMYIALRAIDARRNLDAAHVFSRQEISRVTGLDFRIAGATQQKRQPADFEVRAGTDNEIRAPHRSDQAWSCLQSMRVLECRQRDRYVGIVAGKFLYQRAPFGFAGENLERIRRSGRGPLELMRAVCADAHDVL
jgi:hypothetical protein